MRGTLPFPSLQARGEPGVGGSEQANSTEEPPGTFKTAPRTRKFEFSELLPTVGSSYDFLVALGIVSKCQVMVLAASRTAVPVHRTAVQSHKTIAPASKMAGPADKTAVPDHKINEIPLKKRYF